MTNPLLEPLSLPCGATLSNRLCKAAMSEGLADTDNHSTQRLETLYRGWAASGAGLLLSGNVQVDRFHLERAGNVVIDDDSGFAALSKLAEAGKSGGAHFWLQLSHPGRQVDSAINASPIAPSCVEIDFPRGLGLAFSPPREMTEVDIAKVINQFAFAAGQARAAGFTGVELHAAHGYLISQFLSPLSNRRTDQWGGSLVNRARLLLAVIAAVRAAVGPDFPIGIKLNSSDFQKGGFTNAECIELIASLNNSTLDLLELSGGSLEQPKVVGISLKDEGEDARPAGTVKREAYFIEFSGAVRAVARMPVMVTGGFRTTAGMLAALAAGDLDMVGIGRPMLADPSIPARLLAGEIDQAPSPESSLHIFHLMGWFNLQIERMADGLAPDMSIEGADAAATMQAIEQHTLSRLLAKRAMSRNAALAT
jgi:2,4-dienoyl-CoA reductase-like NADH-dependent reductase (Old Yellow Enzyme family)